MISEQQHQAMNRGWFVVFPALVALLAWTAWPVQSWFRQVVGPAGFWTVVYVVYVSVKFARLRLAERATTDRRTI